MPHTKVNYPILWKLNKKITLATQLRTDTSASASKMQVTNYGLGGLCEPHIDPVGMMEVEKLSRGSLHLPFTGKKYKNSRNFREINFGKSRVSKLTIETFLRDSKIAK